MTTISPDLVTLILTLIAPVVVAVTTKAHASPRLKAAVLLVLTAAITWLGKIRADDGSITITTQLATDWAMTTAVALASYLGFWKPVADINEQTIVAPKVGISDRKDPEVDLENQVG